MSTPIFDQLLQEMTQRGEACAQEDPTTAEPDPLATPADPARPSRGRRHRAE